MEESICDECGEKENSQFLEENDDKCKSCSEELADLKQSVEEYNKNSANKYTALLTEDGQIKANCPICDVEEQIDLLEEDGQCEICTLEDEEED